MQGHTIGIVVNSTWNIYNFRLNLIDKLISEGVKLIVFAPVDEYIIYKKKYPLVQHVPLRNLRRDGTNPIREIALIFELTKKYRQYKPDVLMHYTIKPNVYGAFGAYINRIPSIGVVTGLGYAFLHQGLIQCVAKFLYWISAKLHSRVIFENKEDLTYFVKSRLISGSKGISIKGCGVNTNHFQPMPNGLYPGKVIFTFIGRLLYDKGIREFVEACRLVKSKYHQAEFWVVGELDKKNPSSVKEDDLIHWLKDEIFVYQGVVKDVRPYISHSDCIVLPSYREAIARSLTESMSMQRPVICSDVAGCRETVDHGIDGFIVPPRNPQALANMMEKFIQMNESDRKLMGLSGRKKALTDFDDRIIANQVAGIIAEVASCCPSPLE